MLRLIKPPQQGQGTDPPRRRKGSKPAALCLTADECRHVRAALRNAARAYGGNDVLATVLGVPRGTIHGFCKANRTIPGTFAIRLAKAAGVSVEAILSGAVADASRCQICGHRIGSSR